MTVENRAKQFAPFSALTGLDLALEKKRRELDRSERREFSEESAAELNEQLRALQKGTRVTLRYYCDQEYRSLSGTVDRLEVTEGLLKLDSAQVPIADIAEIESAEPCQFSPDAV
jgi:flagellar motility protein MotE (MotC chaperone)